MEIVIMLKPDVVINNEIPQLKKKLKKIFEKSYIQK